MGRLIIVVLVLVAVALLANKFLIQGGDPPPAGRYDVNKEIGATTNAPADSDGDKLSPAVERDKEASEAKADRQIDPSRVAAAVKEAASIPAIDVELGSEELTAGVPGEDKLTLEQLETWLTDPQNHVTLQPKLPLGLAAGAGAVQGIADNPLTRAKIELGRQLYFDPRLSFDGTISCASCHDPQIGFAANTRFGVGIRKQEGNRNSPVAYNRLLSSLQFWDGRAGSLEAQAVGPIANPIEMGNTHEACVAAIAKIPGYAAQFDAIFEDGLTVDNLGRALATFERVIVTSAAPYDYYQQLKPFADAYADDLEDLAALKKEDPELYDQYMALKEPADQHPISESAVRGAEIFFSDKGGCTACHVGANYSDEQFHNLGVGMMADEPDVGRYEVTKVDKDRGAFKTPTVRNVALTAPYMHDGSQQTLEEVVDWYAKGGHPNEWLSDKVKRLELSDQDKADLVAFMKEGLSSDFPKVERGRLP